VRVREGGRTMQAEVRQLGRWSTAGFEHGTRGHKPKNAGSL